MEQDARRRDGAGTRVSMQDVARAAGVSAQTVSRVANGSPHVVERTRAQVLSAMHSLGYRPNAAARALKSGQFKTIGVLMFSLAGTGNSRTLEAIATHAAREGYGITLIPVVVPTSDAMSGALGRLHELAVDGAIVVMELHLLDSGIVGPPPGIPLVTTDSRMSGPHPVVDTDQAGGARQAVEHLLGLGHETVHHVAGPDDSYASLGRLGSWRETLRASGRAVPAVLRGDWSAESGYRAGLALAEDQTCTAVFVANDHMALGVMRALRERGKAVPEDVSVVGFDDAEGSSHFLPPLTTIQQDFDEIGRSSVAGVIAQIADPQGTHSSTRVATRLIVRDSTAPPGPRRPAS